MLYHIANKGHRVTLAALTAALLVALFSTKAQAEYTFKNSDRTIEARIHGINGSWGGGGLYMSCPTKWAGQDTFQLLQCLP
ncbi:hypothetical protein XJ32_00620 [Helicobacter bilis]|uniref:Uncharacterized protein n=1 Tax=Helicobacter bilis TaxID=37372 RepID=A0A1Q2LEK5_9HELI|nr:hypothetical protein XJ32_00620 [Helicobacter bilis]